ncbi:hypothetical protein HA466_0077130 [Hirschfeldia incana]|nr:hypothetical protein HA466_0077130 [Hirschfeldia incana]
MSSLLLSRLSRLCLRKPHALGVKKYLCGARFLSETSICRIIRADHCQYSSRDESVGKLVIRNVNASEEEDDEVLEKMVPMELMTGAGTIGASHGWVATLKESVVCLQDDLNPRASDADPKRISLPRLETLPHCQTQLVTNVAMSSSSPEDDDCIVAVKFVGPQLSLCRPAEKNKKWVNIRIEDPGFFNSRVMYSKRDGMFSMLDCVGTHIGYWDLEKHRSRNLGSLSYYYEEFVQSKLQKLSNCYRSEHLVEAPTGETFIVKWYSDVRWGSECNFGIPCWQRFMVFKIQYDVICTAISTNDIGDLCIFLSTKGEPFSVKASSYGLNPNCVYYVGDFDFGKVNIRDNVWVGGRGFSPVPYFIPPQSS